MPQINTPDEYAQALERVSRLKERPEGGDASELAELEGAIAEYVSRENMPADSKGRPEG